MYFIKKKNSVDSSRADLPSLITAFMANSHPSAANVSTIYRIQHIH